MTLRFGKDVPPKKPKGQRWSKEETEYLRRMWGREPIGGIARMTGRTPRSIAIRLRALGIPFGVPEGYESLLACTKRTGFCMLTLKMVLKFGNVPTHLHHGRNWKQWKRQYRHRVVDKFDVDEAIAKWLSTETIPQAARRLKIKPRRLEWLLKQAGVAIFRQTAKKTSRKRVFSADADRVVNEVRNNRETLRAAASRYGISHRTLYRWMKLYGVSRASRWHLLEKSVIDVIVKAELARPGCMSPKRLSAKTASENGGKV